MIQNRAKGQFGPPSVEPVNVQTAQQFPRLQKPEPVEGNEPARVEGAVAGAVDGAIEGASEGATEGAVRTPAGVVMLAIIPRTSIDIRPAVAGDLAFVDRLQQMHSKAVGFMPTKQLEQKIARGEVLIAEEQVVSCQLPVASEMQGPSLATNNWQLATPLGYCISSDRYFKRDEVGIIYQMNVVPSAQRKLVAGALLKATFERSPYGCKLFCCWCAQDLAANRFWEAMGFVPLAFRTGAVGKKVRTHIFWQKRIRQGDATTPYWYPCKTDGGSMREDRLVLPIPPGVHWADEMPVLIPEVQNALPSPSETAKRQKKVPTLLPPTRKRVQFGSAPIAPPPDVAKAKPVKPKREKVKADPKHVAAARELRDRYLEHFNGEHLNGEQFKAGTLVSGGKYDVTRAMGAGKPPALPKPAPLLASAA